MGARERHVGGVKYMLRSRSFTIPTFSIIPQQGSHLSRSFVYMPTHLPIYLLHAVRLLYLCLPIFILCQSVQQVSFLRMPICSFLLLLHILQRDLSTFYDLKFTRCLSVNAHTCVPNYLSFCGQSYQQFMLVNYDSRFSPYYNPRVVIYERKMFIRLAIGGNLIKNSRGEQLLYSFFKWAILCLFFLNVYFI